MSSASTCVCCSTSAVPAALSASAEAAKRSGAGGAISRSRRCSVQSPPRSTLVGMPGSGTIEPTASPVPLNSKLVT